MAKDNYSQYNYVGKVLGKAGAGKYGQNAKNFFKNSYRKEKKKSFLARIFRK